MTDATFKARGNESRQLDRTARKAKRRMPPNETASDRAHSAQVAAYEQSRRYR